MSRDEAKVKARTLLIKRELETILDEHEANWENYREMGDRMVAAVLEDSVRIENERAAKIRRGWKRLWEDVMEATGE